MGIDAIKERLEDLKHCGLQENFRIGDYFYSACLWPECPPCAGSWFGCWHWRESEDQILETVIPLFGTWSLLLGIDKEPMKQVFIESK